MRKYAKNIQGGCQSRNIAKSKRFAQSKRQCSVYNCSPCQGCVQYIRLIYFGINSSMGYRLEIRFTSSGKNDENTTVSWEQKKRKIE